MKAIQSNKEWDDYLNEKMTPRQWALYRALRENSENGNKPITQEDICKKLIPEWYGKLWLDHPKHTSDHCLSLWKDAQFINDHFEVDKIVVVEKYTYRLGTEEDCIRYHDGYTKDIIAASRRRACLSQKIGLDGQCKLLPNQLGETVGKPYHEPFVEGGKS